jgi:hypothetical protein
MAEREKEKCKGKEKEKENEYKRRNGQYGDFANSTRAMWGL